MKNSGTRGDNIPAALLIGQPGAGKTSTAEAFASAVGAKKFFYQCVPGTGFDQLIGQPCLEAILNKDSNQDVIVDGILIAAAKAAITGSPVVLILDELDKASPETDSYLLDFLQSRRLRDNNMKEIIIPYTSHIWVFLTSNGQRELSDALMRRVRRLKIERHSATVAAQILHIPQDCALLQICNQSETTIVLMDYDCVETVWFAAEKVAAKRCPYFIDLDERYDEPCEHD